MLSVYYYIFVYLHIFTFIKQIYNNILIISKMSIQINDKTMSKSATIKSATIKSATIKSATKINTTTHINVKDELQDVSIANTIKPKTTKTRKNNKNITLNNIENEFVINIEPIELQNTSIIKQEQEHTPESVQSPDYHQQPIINAMSTISLTQNNIIPVLNNDLQDILIVPNPVIRPMPSIDTVLNMHQTTFGTNKQQLITYHIACKVLEHYNNCIIEYNNTHNTHNTVYPIKIPSNLLETMQHTLIPNIIKDYSKNIKTSKKQIIPDSDRCEGHKIDNSQCSRKKYIKGEGVHKYCKSHKSKLSNENTDNQLQTQTQTQLQSALSIKSKSKRGRKRKVLFDPRRNDNEYITVWEDLIDGHKVLIDNKNNIYTFDIINPVYLGKKTLDFKIDETKINTNSNTTQLPILTPI